jgi:type II secretory pathway component PulF
MNNFTAAQRNYLAWVKANLPEFYADVVQPHLSNASLGRIGRSYLGDDSSGSTFSDILSSISDALPSLAATYATVAGTQAALQTRTNQIATTTTASQNTTKMIEILALGGAALLGIVLLTRR